MKGQRREWVFPHIFNTATFLQLEIVLWQYQCPEMYFALAYNDKSSIKTSSTGEEANVEKFDFKTCLRRLILKL